ncbi:putative adipose-regulatory protein-domain-containing protein [Abortiporus biennis]|nr:putative adipose-regulatory protein-domain-containing protein [Abortiporus biennis]
MDIKPSTSASTDTPQRPSSMSKPRIEEDVPKPGYIHRFLLFIFRFVLRRAKPFAPHLIPLIIFTLAIPVILFLSCSAGWFVWRSIAVGWEETLYLQYGDGGQPYASTSLPHFSSQQLYDISLHLIVPLSESNVALGNFMTTLTLVTTANKTLAHIRRPAIIMPKGTLLRLISPPSSTIALDIPLLSSFEVSSSSVIANIEVGRHDQWKGIGVGHGRELSVASAILRGVVVNKGLRGLITRFPLLTAITSSLIFCFISFIILASCLLPAIEWKFPQDNDEVPETDATLDKPRRRFRHSRETTAESLSEEKGKRRQTVKRSRSATTPRRASVSFDSFPRLEGD